jgi:A/G-specific adenine glycosylase
VGDGGGGEGGTRCWVPQRPLARCENLCSDDRWQSPAMKSLDDADVHFIQRELLSWGKENQRDFPWRQRIPFWLAVVAEILLQRTRAEMVSPAFAAFREEFPTSGSFSNASPDDLGRILRPLGLRKRVRALEGLRQTLQATGRLPRTAARLVRLPGVGPYTAAAALSMHAGVRVPIIESNVARVLARYLDRPIPRIPARSGWLEREIDALTPLKRFRAFDYALLDLGALVCRPRSPMCCRCPLAKRCATSLQ